MTRLVSGGLCRSVPPTQQDPHGGICMSLLNNRIAAVVAGSVLVVGLGATGAVAGSLVTSAQIEDGTIHGKDLNSNFRDRALTDSAVEGVAADGPYPGATNLVHGDNSTSTWT